MEHNKITSASKLDITRYEMFREDEKKFPNLIQPGTAYLDFCFPSKKYTLSAKNVNMFEWRSASKDFFPQNFRLRFFSKLNSKISKKRLRRKFRRKRFELPVVWPSEFLVDFNFKISREFFSICEKIFEMQCLLTLYEWLEISYFLKNLRDF